MYGLILALFLTPSHAESIDAIDARLMDRLGEFVVEGDGPGESIVASYRHETLEMIKWGDATIALGWFTGVLAMERHLVAEAGGDPAPVDARLALALGALERIDRMAETGFDAPCDSFEALNGFFARDDVPLDFHERFDGVSISPSDWNAENDRLKEESQDQVHHLLIGLTLVKRFVPADVEVDGVVLVDQAVELGTRILEFMEEGDWEILNPACGDEPVARGPSAVHAAPGFAGAYRYLTDGGSDLAYPALSESIWEGLSDPDNVFFSNPDNRHMTMATGATARGWGDDTFGILVAMAEPYAWTAYPLLHAALYGADDLDADALEDLLATSRAHLAELDGEEPIRPVEATVPYGWTSWHRYIRPVEKHYVGGDGETGRRYNGIDWLMLRRLVAVVEADLADGVDAADDGEPEAAAGEACAGCTTGGGGLAPWLLAPLAVGLRRRR